MSRLAVAVAIGYLLAEYQINAAQAKALPSQHQTYDGACHCETCGLELNGLAYLLDGPFRRYFCHLCRLRFPRAVLITFLHASEWDRVDALLAEARQGVLAGDPPAREFYQVPGVVGDKVSYAGEAFLSRHQLKRELSLIDPDSVAEKVRSFGPDPPAGWDGRSPKDLTKKRKVGEDGTFAGTDLRGTRRFLMERAQLLTHYVWAGGRFTINLVTSASKSVLFAIATALRTDLWDVPFLRQVWSKTGTLLLFVGSVGQSTGLHDDWTEAFNVAFGVEGAFDPLKPLARWTFFHPDTMGALDAYTKSLGHKQGAYKVFLSDAQVVFLKARFGADKVLVVEQWARDKVFVPVGWTHQVINLQTCVKLAFDFIDPRHFILYFERWRQHKAFMKMPPDYGNFVGCLFAAV